MKREKKMSPVVTSLLFHPRYTKFDLDSGIRRMEIRFSVKTVGERISREFLRPCCRFVDSFRCRENHAGDTSFENDSLHRFLRVFTYFLVSSWIPWKIIATWFSLSLFFLKFQSMFQRYEDRYGRRRNAWRNEKGGERENDKVSRITSSCKNVDMYPACGR